MSPATERNEVQVLRLLHDRSTGTPLARCRGGWEASVVLVLDDSRRLGHKFRFRWRWRAERFLAGLPASPRTPMYALVHRGVVVGVRHER